MMVISNDIIFIEHGGRRQGLPNAPVVIEYDSNRTKESTAIALNIQPIHVFTYSRIHVIYVLQ